MGCWLLALIATASPAGAQSVLRLSEPEVPPPREIHEQGSSPTYYRLHPDTVLPMFRNGIGASVRLPANGEEGRGAFTLDVLGGAELGFGRGARVGLVAETGYSYVGFGEHWLLLGVGPMVRRFGPELIESRSGDEPRGDMAVYLLPHAMVGSLNGAFAQGIRTSLVFRFWLYGLEVGHQLAHTSERDVHELHLAFTFGSTLEDP